MTTNDATAATTDSFAQDRLVLAALRTSTFQLNSYHVEMLLRLERAGTAEEAADFLTEKYPVAGTWEACADHLVRTLEFWAEAHEGWASNPYLQGKYRIYVRAAEVLDKLRMSLFTRPA